MDVTFNNVLEGARQYFQGLPTANCSTTNATYPVSGEHPVSHYGVEQKQERTPASPALSYWPPHHESQLRPQTHESSHHSDAETARLPTQNQNNTPLQEHHRTPTNYHPQATHQEQSVPASHPASYQYNSRIHPQQQHHVSQYQSHIISNPSYHETPTPHPAQAPSSRLHEQPAAQSYHQLQPQAPIEQQQSYTNYQQSRTYYPVNTQTQPLAQTYHSYQAASSQAYPQTQQPSYSNQTYNTHSQNLFVADNSYPTTKTTTQHSQEVSTVKEKQTSQTQQTTQPYRTTHNLPPIAALSNVNYYSNRSRDAIRSATGKTRLVVPNIPTSSYPTKTVTETSISQHPSRMPAHFGDYINNVQHNRPVVSQSYQYSSSVPAVQSNSHFSAATANVSIPQDIHQQSSNSTTYSTTYTPPQEVKAYHQPQLAVDRQQNVTRTPPNNGISSVIKHKRESPLDLSVKTVRTSADSTLEDAEELQRLSKYYQASRLPTHSPLQVPVSYPTYNHYPNSHQRNLTSKSGAPKVDFLPNFNMPSVSQQVPTNKVDGRRVAYDHSRQMYDRKNVYQQQPQMSNSNLARQTNPVPISAHANSNPVLTSTLGSNGTIANSISAPAHNNPVSILNTLANNNTIMQASAKKPIQGLPRIDFLPPAKSSTGYPPASDTVKKRSAEPAPQMVPSKIPKVDMWRQTIDQQIEQKLSSYTKSRLQQEQSQRHPAPNKVTNGNFVPMPHDRNSYQRPQYNPQVYPYNNTQTGHNQTYVPTPAAHQYPGYANHVSLQPQQALYPQHSMQRTNSNPSLSISGNNRNHVGAVGDRPILSLLRNSLEIKGAKEAKRKLEREKQPLSHARTDVQQPSTDVMAPLQPKPGFVSRHNMSPFAATSLFEQSTNTPPTYKFHLPKAIDSIKHESEDIKDAQIPEKTISSKNLEGNSTINNANNDLDGLAAFLAARIRTKAELKQVGSTQNQYQSYTELTRSVSESQLCKTFPKQNAEFAQQSGSPPKITHDQGTHLPRRRLFSKNEGDTVRTAPPRDKTGLRSSSEASVFDFPDSDSDTERHSLEDMRKDRKSGSKSITSGCNNEERPVFEQPTPSDTSFDSACDNFMDQLKARVVKKRGRRKKIIEPEIIAKLEDVAKETPESTDITQKEIKDEPKEEQLAPNKIEPKVESDSDSDVPLINRLKPNSEINNAIKRELSSSDSESEKETTKKTPQKVKVKPVNRNQNIKSKPLTKKSLRARQNRDGAEFYPGWEEEVYNYKRSLRMPASLIHVTRPPTWHRLSTSLPDLDVRPISPSPSENTDVKPTIKIESEVDTNSNFSFSFGKNSYDSEEGNSSVKSFTVSTPNPKTNSILARLIERCGTRKQRKTRKKVENNTPKIIPKSKNEMELLPTPGLEIQVVQNTKNSKKSELIIKEESAFLGFSKKTIDNYKDHFINNSNSLLGINEQFKTVVMKSRTRLETRTIKQKTTIKEVFGADRPASAPPVTCIDSGEQLDDECNIDKLNTKLSLFDNSDTMLENAKDILKNKLLGQGRKSNSLFKSITAKKIMSEYAEDDFIKEECKSETPSIDGDDYITPAKKRIKNIRRKFSSGFDYIRKKKKQIKKEPNESELNSKPKRRGLTLKASPESIQDIQKEIKMWVMNKGIGETHLHRAARCGYTDITAYCLDKMEGTATPKDNAGYTPLHEACARGHLAIAKLLLLYGANVSASAQGGIRPLHEAAENGFVEIVRLLLSYGADPLLATYSGLTPLSLATEDDTINLLQNHIADMQGLPSDVWNFLGPASCFDPEENGYNPLDNVPVADQISEDEDNEFEISNCVLPNLYTIKGESPSEHWILLQDLSQILKIKSRDTLLKQLCPAPFSNSTNTNHKSVLRELKMADFLEQARCCQYLCAGEKINTRASKVALVKYSDRVRQLLAVEKSMITVR